jgi:hypothetical protein
LNLLKHSNLGTLPHETTGDHERDCAGCYEVRTEAKSGMPMAVNVGI